MKKFRTTFEMEVDVHFVEPDKAAAYYIDGDWGDHFHKVDDLGEVAEHLSAIFSIEDEKWDSDLETMAKFLEGFGTFVRKADHSWYLVGEEFTQESGGIIIRYEMELEATSTYERLN